MPDDQTFAESHLTPSRRDGSPRGPVTWLLDFFSGFRLCVLVLSSLFIYCSIGSAGMFVPDGWNLMSWEYQQIRQWPVFEMTEFEWFHTPVFYGLCALLCFNMTMATIRRIPLNAVKFGSWMIHGGIIVMVVGCVIYFATKIEGDAPVWRRAVVVTVPGGHSATLPAIVGRTISVQGEDGPYSFRVMDINPAWPILSGDDEGKEAYSVSVRVSTPRDTFVRQLLADYPQYTEDVIPGEGRVVKIDRFGGSKIVDDTVALSLMYDPQDRFWVKDSSAIYVRPVGAPEWDERPVDGMPRYNAWLSKLDDAFPDDRTQEMLRPLSLAAAPESADGLDAVTTRVIGYLPYAVGQSRFMDEADAPLNPAIDLEIARPGDSEPVRAQLSAFDAETSAIMDGAVRFAWIDNPALERLIPAGYNAVLTLEIPEIGRTIEVPFSPTDMGDREAEFEQIEGTAYSYRVSSVIPRFPVGDTMVSMAIMEFRTPEGEFGRWVFSDPALTRDLDDGAHMPDTGTDSRELDARFVTSFGAVSLGTVTVVAGPEGVTPRVLVLQPSGAFTAQTLDVGGDPTPLAQGIELRVAKLYANAREVARPRIIPASQRDRDMTRGRFYSMALVEMTYRGATQSKWVTYHQYAFDRELYYGGSMGRYDPTVFDFVQADGRTARFEALFSRETEPMGNPVVLDDFVLEERVGGYTSSAGAQAVRNWTSELRFLEADGEWSSVRPVSANNPKAFGGLWHFQASWDPPREPSQQEPNGYAGLNHTGLGVGNREGVWTMLIGSALSVLGMLYAFYLKPVIKRRRRDEVFAQLPEQAAKKARPVVEPEPRRPLATAMWFVVGVLIACGTAALALNFSLRDAQADTTTFAGQVDLTPLDRSAVYSRGRLKSFDSFANEFLGFISGPRRIDGQPKDFTYIDLMLVPERYARESTIYIKKPQIRQKLLAAARPLAATMQGEERAWFEGQLASLEETGLVAAPILEMPEVATAIAVLKADVVRTAKFANQIENAMVYRRPEVLGDILRIVPPPSGRDDELWLSPFDLFADVTGRTTPGAISASEMAPERREDLRDAFSAFGDTWWQTRTLELAPSSTPIGDPRAFEDALDAWVAMVPDDRSALANEASVRFEGAEQLDPIALVERLDAVAAMVDEAELSWNVAGPFFSLLHRAESALPRDMAPERITIGAERTSTALARFCDLLDEGAGEKLYPQRARLNAESWYFKAGGATWIWLVYLLSVLMLLMAVVYKWNGARAMGMGLFSSAFLMHSVVLGWRWYVSGRWPNSNMFEAVTTSVWLGTLCVIVMELLARRTPLRNLFALGAGTASMVAMMSADFLPQLDSNIGNMMPILHDLWLYIHTNVIIASYALIAMGAVCSLLYLAWRALGKGPDHATVGGTDMLLRTAPGSSAMKKRVSAGAVFDGATMILIELSFVMLWAGLVMGAIWADHSWGRPWGWDPKEVFALNTFFIYLILIHVRASSKDKGLWTALLSLIGCGVMLFNWIVINFVISGLHSYA